MQTHKVFGLTICAILLLGTATTYATVTARYNLAAGTNYVYDLSIGQTQTIDSDFFQEMHTTEATFTGTVTSEVSSYNDQRFTRLITYVIDDGESSIAWDSSTLSTTSYSDEDLQAEKVDNRGFSRIDVTTYSNFDALCDDAGATSYDVKPFLSGLFMMELPLNAMVVNNTWTTYKTIFTDFSNAPTIGIRYTLLAESETHLGVSCAKYRVQIINGTFSNVTRTESIPDVGSVTSILDCSAASMTGTLWFDISGGKIIEWDADISFTIRKRQNIPANTDVTAGVSTSINYVYQGTR
jgi:hypothetical protein